MLGVVLEIERQGYRFLCGGLLLGRLVAGGGTVFLGSSASLAANLANQ